MGTTCYNEGKTWKARINNTLKTDVATKAISGRMDHWVEWIIEHLMVLKIKHFKNSTGIKILNCMSYMQGTFEMLYQEIKQLKRWQIVRQKGFRAWYVNCDRAAHILWVKSSCYFYIQCLCFCFTHWVRVKWVAELAAGPKRGFLISSCHWTPFYTAATKPPPCLLHPLLHADPLPSLAIPLPSSPLNHNRMVPFSAQSQFANWKIAGLSRIRQSPTPRPRFNPNQKQDDGQLPHNQANLAIG